MSAVRVRRGEDVFVDAVPRVDDLRVCWVDVGTVVVVHHDADLVKAPDAAKRNLQLAVTEAVRREAEAYAAQGLPLRLVDGQSPGKANWKLNAFDGVGSMPVTLPLDERYARDVNR